MRKRLVGALAVSAFASALFVASASAATEVGSDCEASGMVVGATLFPLTVSPNNSLPIGALASGVATKWRVRSPGSDVHTEKLKVFRPAFASNQIQVVAESSLENVTDGHETFDIRIPVQAGDRFGVAGKFGEGAIACIPGRPGDISGIFLDESQPGQTQTFSEDNGFQAAVSAVVEPDADGDGYGDETQDGCPAVTALQTACPAVTLTRRKATVVKRAILVQVRVSSEAEVKIFGQVSWRVRQRSGGNRGLTAGLSAGRARAVAPGTTAVFRLPLTKPVKRRLERLEPDQSLRAQLTAQVTDLGGQVSERRFKVRLKGRG